MSSDRTKRSTARRLQLAKEYLIANRFASNMDVVRALGISPRTVSAARSALVQQGLIPRAFHDRTSAPVLSTSSADDLEEPTETLLPGRAGGYTVPEMREELTRVARQAELDGNGPLQISAIQAIAKLDAQMGEKNRRGPPPPLTPAAKIDRLSMLIDVCGPEIAASAARKAFDDDEFTSFTTFLGHVTTESVL